MLFLFLGMSLGKTFYEPIFNFEVGRVGRPSEVSETDTVIACHFVLFVDGGFEG